MNVKLKNIAQASGVSISTVSRILNNDTSRKSKESTITRVIEIAKSMGYFDQPAFTRNSVEFQKPLSIGCIFTSEHESYVSPFFSTLLAGIQKELCLQMAKRPYTFHTISISDAGFYSFFESNNIDGAIILGRTSLKNITFLKEQLPYLVYAGLNSIENDIDEVLCDAHEGIVSVVSYLAGLGHTEIGYIGPTQKKYQVFNEHRYKGFESGMKENSLEINTDYVRESILTAASGYEAMQSIINRKKLPTAIVCGNDTLALGVLRSLEEHRMQVPQHISLVGFDNIETISYIKPSLTTIDVPKTELGRLAVKVLLDKLETKRNYHIKVYLPFSLIERESCRRL